jgi:hypothetical protein
MVCPNSLMFWGSMAASRQPGSRPSGVHSRGLGMSAPQHIQSNAPNKSKYKKTKRLRFYNYYVIGSRRSSGFAEGSSRPSRLSQSSSDTTSIKPSLSQGKQPLGWLASCHSLSRAPMLLNEPPAPRTDEVTTRSTATTTRFRTSSCQVTLALV